MRYHTVIIGAGMSGLAAGIRLAYYEKPVCVVERHTTIGGLNSFYRLRHRDYDVGLHAVTNYARPGTKTGPLSKLLRQLRLRWEDFDLVPQYGSRIDFPGHRLRFSNDFTLLEQEVAEQFPQRIDCFRKLTAQVLAFDELNLQQQPVSARQVLDDVLGDPLLRDMLLCPLMFYGSARARDMDFQQFVIMFKSIFREGFARPVDGVRRILKHLVKKYRELGGVLRLRSGVSQILSAGGRVTGVRLDSGEVIEAEHVVSSAGLVETLALCDTPPDPRQFSAENLQPGQVTFCETIATLDCQPAELGHRETIIFYNDTPEFTYDNPAEPCDLRSGIICSPNNFAYDEHLPEGTVRITALANKDFWTTLPDADYRREKQRWYDRLTAAALGHIPDFRPRVVDTDMFTPRTIRRFTGHVNGCVYGAPVKRLDGTTHLAKLYLCGTDQGFLGIIGSMLSGITIANLHLLAGE